ncbi:hypothetical protein EVAR_65839_1 [Eumeta japonica]|uniref:Uncharacterized protein n=1 Tax=Eumeta variegata TaxID=151549 RepID=A0A4C1ZK30_EUMVA|nr:hypothetical protein EVAR_65839_1 [Eumeta japonica]
MEPEGKHWNSVMKQRILVVFGSIQIVLRCTLTVSDFQDLMMLPEGPGSRCDVTNSYQCEFATDTAVRSRSLAGRVRDWPPSLSPSHFGAVFARQLFLRYFTRFSTAPLLSPSLPQYIFPDRGAQTLSPPRWPSAPRGPLTTAVTAVTPSGAGSLTWCTERGVLDRLKFKTHRSIRPWSRSNPLPPGLKGDALDH